MINQMTINHITRRVALALILLICTSSLSFSQILFEKSIVQIKRQNNSIVTFDVEIARSPTERAQGLMNRQTMADNAGMFFIWPGAGLRQFWMKDTLISLDILFFDDEGVLVHYEDHTKPNSKKLISSLMPVAYVLEINAGQREANDLEIGDYLYPATSRIR